MKYSFFKSVFSLLFATFSLLSSEPFYTFEYDSEGRIACAKKPDGRKTTYRYDVMNRISRIAAPSQTIEYTYDANGNRIQMKDSGGETEYYYHPFNLLDTVTDPLGISVGYIYDFRSRLNEIKYPAQTSVQYEYDLADRLTKVVSSIGTTEYIYNQLDNTLKKIVLPNGTFTEYGHDAAKRVTDVSHRYAAGSLICSFHYKFDGNGNCTRKEIKKPQETAVTEYSYDKLDRLISVNGPDLTEQYTYDGLGNRLTKETSRKDQTLSHEKINYIYDDQNRLIQANEIVFSYDNSGNLIKKTSPKNTCTYSYDEHDNLIEFQDKDHIVFYGYDGEGRRISKTVNGVKTLFINDIRSPVTQVLIEISENLTIKAIYTYGLGRISIDTTKGTGFYLTDHPIGHVIGITEDTQHVCNSYEYDAFGVPRVQEEKIPNPYLYANEAYEPESGLIFLRNRYYDPEIGRFISADPMQGSLTNPQEFNPYTYVNNNPMMHADPLGLLSAEACGYFPGTMTERGISEAGHGFWIFTYDNGKVTTVGRWIEEVAIDGKFDKKYPGTVSHKWPATDAQINLMIERLDKKPWSPLIWFFNNCINGLEVGLEVLGVDHPNFRVSGIPCPNKACIWLKSLQEINSFTNQSQTDLRAVSSGRFSVFNPITSSWIKDSLNAHHPMMMLFHEPGNFQFMTLFPGTMMRLAELGGVSLHKTAEVIGNISEITGVTFDSARGQLIFLGRMNKQLPPMNFDDIAVAVRAIYGLGGKEAAIPGVSIDHNPENNKILSKIRDFDDLRKLDKLHPSIVRYDGRTENTHFGQVMFESDRLLKNLIMGKDNITKQHIKAHVDGYKSLKERYNKSTSPVQIEGSRMWISPKEVTLRESNDGSTFFFDPIKMEVLTDLKIRNRHITDPVPEAFAQHFTANYDAFAHQFPILEDLKQLSKITGIVKWVREREIPFDLSLFENYTPIYYPTPLTTPTTYFHTDWNSVLFSIPGGVSYILDEKNFFKVLSEEAREFGDIILQSRPSDDAFSWEVFSEGTSYTAIAQTVERTPKVGNVKKTFLDLQIAVPGEFPLQLIRFYNSFNDRLSGFGYGWDIAPAALRFPKERTIFSLKEDPNAVILLHPEISVIYEGSESMFRLADAEPRKGTALYLSSNSSSLSLSQSPEGYKLSTPDNSAFIFDQLGKLTQIVDRYGISLYYNYTENALTSISHQNGQRILIEYQQGRIIRANEPGGQTVEYKYDQNQCLQTVSDSEGIICTYEHDVDKNLNAIYNGKGDLIFEAEYDNCHRAISVKNGAHALRTTFNSQDHTAQSETDTHLQYVNKYDAQYRLLSSFNSTGKNVEISYEGLVPLPTKIKKNAADEAHLSYDADGNLKKIQKADGAEELFWYDLENRLIGFMDGRKKTECYLYDAKGVLEKIAHFATVYEEEQVVKFTFNPAYTTSFSYDSSNGRLTSTRKSGQIYKTFGYDDAGRLIRTTDPYGYEIKMEYDAHSNLEKVYDKTGGFAYYYDGRGRVVKATSPIGNIEQSYDKAGHLCHTKDPNGNETFFEYDENDRLIMMIDPESGIAKYEYNQMGGLSRAFFPNGTIREIIYDEFYRPTGMRWIK